MKDSWCIETFDSIVFHLSRNYGIEIEELENCSIGELTELIRRFPYRMSILIKYKDTDAKFQNKLNITKHNICYQCNASLFNKDRYEIIGIYELEYICKNCYNKQKELTKSSGIVQAIYDIEGLN